MVCLTLLGITPDIYANSARAQGYEGLQRVTTGLTDAMESAIDLLPQGVTNIGLGLGPAIYPTFEGSRDYSVHAIGVISFRYKDYVEVVNNEIHITAFNRLVGGDDSGQGGHAWRAGPLISINFGRDEEDDPALKGLGDVHDALELGGFVAYSVGDVRLRLRARQDVISGHKGATAQFDVSKTFVKRARFSVSGFVAMEGASAAYMKSFFGITPLQAERSGLPEYHAAPGLKDGTVGLNSKYQLTTHWSVFANAAYERLMVGAADSPLVQQRGTPNLASFSAFVVYLF